MGHDLSLKRAEMRLQTREMPLQTRGNLSRGWMVEARDRFGVFLAEFHFADGKSG